MSECKEDVSSLKTSLVYIWQDAIEWSTLQTHQKCTICSRTRLHSSSKPGKSSMLVKHMVMEDKRESGGISRTTKELAMRKVTRSHGDISVECVCKYRKRNTENMRSHIYILKVCRKTRQNGGVNRLCWVIGHLDNEIPSFVSVLRIDCTKCLFPQKQNSSWKINSGAPSFTLYIADHNSF